MSVQHIPYYPSYGSQLATTCHATDQIVKILETQTSHLAALEQEFQNLATDYCNSKTTNTVSNEAFDRTLQDLAKQTTDTVANVKTLTDQVRHHQIHTIDMLARAFLQKEDCPRLKNLGYTQRHLKSAINALPFAQELAKFCQKQLKSRVLLFDQQLQKTQTKENTAWSIANPPGLFSRLWTSPQLPTQPSDTTFRLQPLHIFEQAQGAKEEEENPPILEETSRLYVQTIADRADLSAKKEDSDVEKTSPMPQETDPLYWQTLVNQAKHEIIQDRYPVEIPKKTETFLVLLSKKPYGGTDTVDTDSDGERQTSRTSFLSSAVTQSVAEQPHQRDETPLQPNKRQLSLHCPISQNLELFLQKYSDNQCSYQEAVTSARQALQTLQATQQQLVGKNLAQAEITETLQISELKTALDLGFKAYLELETMAIYLDQLLQQGQLYCEDAQKHTIDSKTRDTLEALLFPVIPINELHIL